MKTYGLLGEKLSHSFSPQIHARLADCPYLLFEKTPDEVGPFLKSGGFDGINVTIPYKKTVIPFCAELSPAAERIGSVNTILRRGDGTLYGDNTDCYGFAYMLKKSGVSVAGKKVLVLGSGGASLTVRSVLSELGAGDVVTISRGGANNYENLHRHADAQVIVNTTPVGMYPNNGLSPLDLKPFGACRGVLDLIYNPAKTKLLLDAGALGLPCLNGLAMLVAQAKRACELFLSEALDDSVIDTITEDISLRTKNIALIGMPGCGKSTTGRALAEKTDREFLDTDDMVVSAAGKSIERIFAEDGEAAFRRLESEALSAVAKLSGKVISTGGGVVTQAHNRELLMQNSTVVFLSRPAEDLPTDGRPLSRQRSVGKLAEERLPLYRLWCDCELDCRGVEPTVDLIIKELGL